MSKRKKDAPSLVASTARWSCRGGAVNGIVEDGPAADSQPPLSERGPGRTLWRRSGVNLGLGDGHGREGGGLAFFLFLKPPPPCASIDSGAEYFSLRAVGGREFPEFSRVFHGGAGARPSPVSEVGRSGGRRRSGSMGSVLLSAESDKTGTPGRAARDAT